MEYWTPEDRENELIQRKTCDWLLYVITPKMKGVYSIAEVIDDSNKDPEKTLFCILEEDKPEEFSAEMLKSLKAIKDMALRNGAKYFGDFEDVAHFLNSDRLLNNMW